jgi:hypothetical protein
VRLDHPELDDANWLRTLVASPANGEIAIRTESMQGVWDRIRPPGLAEGLPARLQELLVRSLPRALVQRIMRRRVADFAPGELA